MTPTEQAEWQERLQAAVAETLRKREERKRIRDEFAAARTIGLKRRHHQKLHGRKDNQ
ncbi:hypothetical protein AB0H57_24580 [Micromonospora sp. NPDC050686]|uniref:hypothetical protein n=1 Tax=Micromonospora sp. NPDC050686 TaxID=3154631 RepID=UPI0033F97619